MSFFGRLKPLAVAVLGVALVSGCDKPRGSAPVEVVERTEPKQPQIPQDTQTRDYLEAGEAELAARQGLIPASTKSVMRIERQMRHGQYEWQDDIGEGPLAVRVDLKRQLVSAYRDGHEIGAAVILYGAEGLDTPTGQFPILRMSETYHSRTYDNAPMPYSLWLTNDGVALHGSRVEGGRATHGCVGVPVGFAEKLFAVAKVGDVVEIVGDIPNAA